ncbi:GPI inositol deacylase [Coemansia erecta]|uniref:GPI inositol-deacylase n=1 Tax=Coemansia erecta TaxID=147472 RepID=A0A9W8CV45_9FUNG|nr:GPI inositol deacylase [Coemansia erecta]
MPPTRRLQASSRTHPSTASADGAAAAAAASATTPTSSRESMSSASSLSPSPLLGSCADTDAEQGRGGRRGKSSTLLALIRAHSPLLALLLFTVTFGLLTARSYFSAQPDTPSCVMSYSRPRFVELTQFDSNWTRFATKYRLYLYREGGYDAFDEGYRIPVLFVPGNAGSPKQVRSIASATTSAFIELMATEPDAVAAGRIGYDFFTVGLNEEFTALHGYSILEQADFINDAIRYILSLYPRTRKNHRGAFRGTDLALPTSVVVIGHSMGGVVARTAFTLPNHVVGSVRAIFTLSTPHNNPTASLEYYVDRVYSSINQFWRHGFHHGTLGDVSLVSIAGGNLDSMINSDYTYVGDLAPSTNALSVLSSGIEDVWLSLDHQSILWCAQMARKFASLMMLIMDARRPEQLVPLDERMRIMRQALYSPLDTLPGAAAAAASVGKAVVPSTDYRYAKLYDDDVVRTDLPDRHAGAAGNKGPSSSGLADRALHLIRAGGRSGGTSGQISLPAVLQVVHTMPNGFRLFGCQPLNATIDAGHAPPAQGDFSCTGVNVPAEASLPMRAAGGEPAMDDPRLKYLEVPVAGLLDRFEYIGIELPTGQTSQTGFLRAGIVDAVEPLVHRPGYLQLLKPYAISADWQGANAHTGGGSRAQSVRTQIRLDVPENPFFVFRASLALRRSRAAKLGERPRFGAAVRQSDGARQFESKFWYARETMDVAIHGRGAYKPSDAIAAEASAAGQGAEDVWRGVFLDVWVDADHYAGVDVRLRINWYSSLNRLVKRYDMALLALSFVWACLVLLDQLRAWNSGGSTRFPGCLASIERLVRNGTLAGMAAAAAATTVVQGAVGGALRGVWGPAAAAAWGNLFMGFRGEGVVSLCLVPVVLVVVSLGFVAIEAIVLTVVCSAVSWAVAHVSRRFGTRLASSSRTAPGSDLSKAAGTSVARPLVATVGFVVFVCTLVPYQFAFLVIYFAQLMTAIRTMAHARVRGSGGVAAGALGDRAHYQLALLLFWTSSLPYCAPELLVWVRNLGVLWFEDAPSDHNLINMAGYFALRMVASNGVVPRLLRGWGGRVSRCVTYVGVGLSVGVAWLWGVRRPYVLYSVGNGVSAWLAAVQLAEYLLGEGRRAKTAAAASAAEAIEMVDTSEDGYVSDNNGNASANASSSSTTTRRRSAEDQLLADSRKMR